MRDLTYALRSLRKSPGFAISALAILSLGIGANTAIFGIVDAVLLKPLPFPDSYALTLIQHTPPAKSFPGIATFAVSAGNYLDWRKQNTVFDSIALVGGRNVRLGGTRPQSFRATTSVADFFSVLRMQPALGRGFTTAECEPGHDDVVVLSDGFARSQFGAPANALGHTLELNGRQHRVIGIMPPEFTVRSWFPAANEMLLPLTLTPEQAAVRGNHNFGVVARLRSGASVTAAQTQMNVISDRLARDYPEENTGWGAVVTTVRDTIVGDVRPALLTLLGAVGFVLLIACANTANLVLARTITRRKELAIRAAMGASRSEIIRPVLLETLLLSLAGAAIGLAIAQTGQSLVIKALADQLPRAVDIRLDARVLAFTLVAAVATGLISGWIAAWRLSRINLNDSLKQGFGKTDSFSGGARTRGLLVVAEVGLSLVLLIGAALMIRSLWALHKVDPGFVPSNVLTMRVPVPQSSDATKRGRLYSEFLPQVGRLPGVVAIGAIDVLPLSGGGGSQQPIVIEGRPAEVFALQPNVGVRQVTPHYFETLRIPLIAGRDFDERDTEEKAKAVIVVSQALARQFWPNENPVGKRLTISFSKDIMREVIGVVGDVKERGLQVLELPALLYVPAVDTQPGNLALAVRADRNAANLAPAITQILQGIDPRLPVRDVRMLDEVVAVSLSQRQFSMYLFMALAALAFALAVVGIYSVLAYTVRSRVQEISIRMALGAQLGDVLKLVVTEGMKPALAGIVVGAAGAWLLSGVLSRLVFGVSSEDPLTFAIVAALLATVALLACLIPAFRATRVEPVAALRNE